jgi:circadian clock protein KaiB
MTQSTSSESALAQHPGEAKPPPARLRLYVARTTPNSARAEQNLKLAMNELDDGGAGLGLEIVDVFRHPKRALTDGVIVTPTLIGLRADGRLTMMGDLTDKEKLSVLLQTMLTAAPI